MRAAWLVMLLVSCATAQAANAVDHARAGTPIAPADRLAELDRFRDSLSPGDRQRLDEVLPRSADGGIARCDGIERSRASCEAAAYMPALRSTGLMARFRAMRRARRS